MPVALRGPGLAAAATLLAAAVTAVVLVGFSLVSFPAYGNSNVLRALTVVGQTAAVALVVLGVLCARAGERPGGRPALVRAGKLAAPTGSALLVATTLGIPLAASRLYLHGVSVDQEFRTQFLGRSATSLGLPDMAYADLPSFYPSGWFWLGGRFADLAGLEGWAAYKPWSILSLAVAAALVTVLWTRLLRTDLGAVVGVASTAVMLAYGSPEPYGAVVALFLPPVLILAWHAVAPTSPRGGRGATLATTLYLGASASTYTLYTGLAAGTVVLMAVVATAVASLARRGVGDARERPAPLHSTPLWLPAARLAAIGFGSIAIALVVWAPYLIAALGGAPADSGTALHYLPDAGARLPLPMTAGGLTGWVCLAGLVWIVARAWTSRRAQALGLGVVTVYLWSLASMAVTVLGTTMLGFRLEPVLILLLVVAGVFGIADLAGYAVRAAGRQGGADRPAAEAADRRRRATAVVGVVATLAGLAHVQGIPDHLHEEIRLAYTDTDGDGERADRYPPGPESHYAEVDRVILEAFPGREKTDLVVASTADAFLAFHPYLAYQAVTSHYANPLGRYAERNEAMIGWEDATSGDELYAMMNDTPWRRPDAIVARPSGSGYSLRLAEDTYPNDPNVRRFGTTIPAEAVTGPHFEVHDVGPFAVIVVR
ncbi:arabinofuranosyltransferase [Dietzia psychralcaliphila]|uniref:Galactan 5-O-arabinofuranosyltransferase n=1 Tax=Dietzia psychralcaliphila TaxID=139021 RepID=A0AAD0JQ95_9ACTN|nr:arabinofuranosyltransferase [Dietzia psychralcaliphila]AWH94412.1 arabinofuranosyltransferase [Dietzia psychralcaliphila]PTM88045.1 galactan 5-O-arabinofuranosyltransferase [Dietzia psychralcaliphila]